MLFNMKQGGTIMLTSLILAKIAGLYCLFVGLAMLINPHRFKTMIHDFVHSPAALHLAAFITLILGIILTVFHNVWTWDWRVLITIVAWLTLIKGLILLFVPTLTIKSGKAMESSNTFYVITAIITLLVGIILAYYGFIY